MTYQATNTFAGPSELYAALFAALPGNSILVQINSPHFSILAVTQGMIERSGLSKERLVNKPFFEPFPANTNNPEDLNAEGQNITLASFEQVIKTGKPHLLPLLRYDLEDEAGVFKELYWSVSNKPVLNGEGEVIYIIHTSEDVTEKIKSQQKDEKIKSMESVNNLFMQAPFAIHIFTGPDLIIEMANKPTLELWGRTEDVIGRSFLDVLPELEGLGYDRQMHEVMQSGKSCSFYEVPLSLNRRGKEESGYFNFIFQPYYKAGSTKAESVLVVANEVTEQVRARKQVEKSEARLELLSNAVPAMIFYLDGEQRYQSYNERFMEWFDVDAKEAIGRTVREFLGEEAFANAQPHLAIAYSGMQEQYEMFAPSKMNRGRWLSIVYTPHKSEDGKVIGVIVHASDITQVKEAETALQESEARFRNLADDSPMFVFIIGADPEASVIHWNKTWLDYTGQSLEQAIGRAWDDIIHPDDVPIVMEHYTPAFGNRIAYFIPAVRVKRHDGEYRWHAFKGNPRRRQNGDFDGYVGVGLDVHEQKLAEEAIRQSEQDLRDMILAAPVGICLIDASTLVSEIVNESFIEVAGKPLEAIMGNRYWDTFAEAKPYYEAALQGVIETGEPYFANKVELMLLRHGMEETVFVTFVYLPMKSSKGKGKGKVKKVVIYVLENTPQVLARQKTEDLVAERTKELADAIKELQRSNENLEEFAHAASHDLKEPIRKIHFFSNRLKGQLSAQLNETQLQLFNRIENAIERMGMLIDDLLLYSHVSHRPYEMEVIDLNQKLRRVLEDLELDVEEKKATVHVGNLPMVKGYRRQLQQLFQNLISNALKYSKTGIPPIIDICSKMITENGQSYHAITITDNGIGFEQQYADKIFKMFSRLHGRNEYSGTGVGLSIVKKVVQNHRGFIKVESSPGNGSTFRLFLPAD